MVAFEASFFYATLGLLAGFPCLYLFGRLSRRIKFIWIVWTAWTLFGLMVPSSLILLYYLSPGLGTNVYYLLWQACAFSSMVSLTLLFYILLILNPDHHGWLKSAFFWSFLWISVILTNIYYPETYTSLELGSFVLRLPLDMLLLVLISTIPIFQTGFGYLNKIRAHILKNKEKFGNLFFWGFILLVLSYPLSFTLSSLIISPIFGALFIGIFSVGGVCVGYALAHNQRILFLIPNMVIEISIFHKSGLKLLAIHLRPDYQPTELKQGVIIGLQGLLTDLLGNDIVQEIKLKDRHVLLMYNQRLGYIVVLATVQIHRIMKLFLQEYARSFEKHFQKELQECLDINNPIDPAKFKSFEDLTRQLFAI